MAAISGAAVALNSHEAGESAEPTDIGSVAPNQHVMIARVTATVDAGAGAVGVFPGTASTCAELGLQGARQ
ncbi:hypothetical protein GCM10027258_71150 [Amycolatopsis stemonae]